MTQPDETHIALYRVIVDYAELFRENAKATASQKALADSHVAQNERIKRSDNDVSQNRQRLALIERGLTEDKIRRHDREEDALADSRLELNRYDQAVARLSSTQRQASTLSDSLLGSIGRQVDALLRARRAFEEHTRAVQAGLTATNSFIQAQSALGVPGRPGIPGVQGGGGGGGPSLGGGGGVGGGVGLAQLAAVTALLGSQIRAQQAREVAGGSIRFIGPPPGGSGGGGTGPAPIPPRPSTPLGGGPTPPAIGSADQQLRTLFEAIRREVVEIRHALEEAASDNRQQRQVAPPLPPPLPSSGAEGKSKLREFTEEDKARSEGFFAAFQKHRPAGDPVAAPNVERVTAENRKAFREQLEREAATTEAAASATEKLSDALREQSGVLKEAREAQEDHVDAAYRGTEAQRALADQLKQSDQAVMKTAALIRSIRSREEGEELLQPLTMAQRGEVGRLVLQQDLPRRQRELIESVVGGAANLPTPPSSVTAQNKQVDDAVESLTQAKSPQEAADILLKSKLTNDQLKIVSQRLGGRLAGVKVKRDIQERILGALFGADRVEGLLPPRPTPQPRSARPVPELPSVGPLASLSQGHVPGRLEERMEIPRSISDKVSDLRRDQAKAHKDDIDALRFASDETRKAHDILATFVPLLERKNEALRDQKKAHEEDRTAMGRSVKMIDGYAQRVNELSSDLQHFQDRLRQRQAAALDVDTDAIAGRFRDLTDEIRTQNEALRDNRDLHTERNDAVGGGPTGGGRRTADDYEEVDRVARRATGSVSLLRLAIQGVRAVARSQRTSRAAGFLASVARGLANRVNQLVTNVAPLNNAVVGFQMLTQRAANGVQNLGNGVRNFYNRAQQAAQGVSFLNSTFHALHVAGQRASNGVTHLSNAVRTLRNRLAGSNVPTAIFERLGAIGDRVGRSILRATTHIVSFRAAVYSLIALLGPVVAVLGALGAAAIGAGNTLASLAGVVAALPAAFGAAVTGIGALVAALGPIANVLKAYQATQKEAAAGSRALGDAQREAASRVRNAERAYVNAARGLANAQYDERKAQQDLNRARRDALRDLQDLRAELERTTLNEQDAILSLKEAQDAYLRTLADPNATLLDRERALLRIYQAEQDLKDVRRDNQRIVEDAAEAERRGIENSERVIDAKRRSFEASEAVIDAQIRLADATEDLADAQHAQASGGASAARAADALADALDKLGPNSKAVALFAIEMAKAWEKVRTNVSERLFAPIVPQLENLKSLLPVVEMFLTGAADAIGNVAARGIEMVSSGPWKSDFATLAESNTRILSSFGDAGLAVADAFRHITVAAAPFSEWVAEAIARTARGFRDWAKGARESGAIADFLETTQDRLSQVWRILKNLGAGFASLFKASEEFTSWFLDRIERVTERFRAWGKVQEETNSPFKRWLEDVKPLLSDVWGLVESLAGSFSKMAGDPKNMKEAREILQVLSDRILPTIAAIFSELSESGTMSTLFEAIATFLEAVKSFADSGGTSAFQDLASALLIVANVWKFLAENPITATLLSAVASGIGILIAASAIGKLTGLFALGRALRRIAYWGARARGLNLGNLGGGVTGGGGLGGPRGQTPANPLYVHVVNHPGTPGRGGGGGGVVATGGGGGGGAPTSGRPSRGRRILSGVGRLALPAALAALILPDLFGGGSEEGGGVGGVEALGLGLLGADILSNFIGSGGGGGGGAGGAGGGGILGRLGSAGRFIGRATLPTAAIAASATNIFSAGRELITDPASRADPTRWATLASPIQRTVPSVAGFIGRNLVAPLLPSSNRASDPSFWTPQNLMPTKERLGQLLDEFVVKPGTEFFRSAADWLKDNAGKPLEWLDEHIGQPLREWLTPFGDIIGGIRDTAEAGFTAIGEKLTEVREKAGEWIDDNVIKPGRFAFGFVKRHFQSAVGPLVQQVRNNVLFPARDLFVNLGRRLVSGARSAAGWVRDHALIPTRNFFVGIGNTVAGWYRNGKEWVRDHLLRPTANFFKSVGNFIRALPSAIERWAESLPFGVGDAIRRRRQEREAQSFGSAVGDAIGSIGFQYGGLIRGRSGGVDVIPILATAGEFMIRKSVVDKPGVRALLSALNEEKLDPAALYAALDVATRRRDFPYTIPSQIIGAAPTTIHNTRTGLAVGDVIINNPRQERSSSSLRQTLQTLAFMAER